MAVRLRLATKNETDSMKKTTPPKLKRFPGAKQRELDELLEKNSEGIIRPAELARLETLVAQAERLMVANAQRLAEFSRREESDAPADAVPVTIWVKPEIVER
jgi:hypothetical protein